MTAFKIGRLACIATLISLLAPWPASAATDLISADELASHHVYVETVRYYAEMVDKGTDGEVRISVRPDGMLGDTQDVLDKVRDGGIAMTRVNLGELSTRTYGAELASLPYLFRSESHLKKVLDGSFGQRLDKELEEHGYVRLMYIYGGPRDFFCTSPIYGLSDFRGMRIRTMDSPSFKAMVQDFGAIAVNMPMNQTADAFQRKQIDCAADNVETYMSEGLYKFAPYLIQDEHARIPDLLLISRKVWDRLTAEQQGVMRQAAQTTMQHMLPRWKEIEDDALAKARKAGVTIIPHTSVAYDVLEEQAARYYNQIVRSPRDLDMIMQIVTTR